MSGIEVWIDGTRGPTDSLIERAFAMERRQRDRQRRRAVQPMFPPGTRDPWFRAVRTVWSPYLRCTEGRAWQIWFMPMPSLMRRADEGRRILCVLSIEFEIRWPIGVETLQQRWNGDPPGWRAPFRLRLSTDAEEIARRRAGLA